MKALTKQEKHFLWTLLGTPDYALTALSSEYSEGKYIEFKENYGITHTKAIQALKKLNSELL